MSDDKYDDDDGWGCNPWLLSVDELAQAVLHDDDVETTGYCYGVLGLRLAGVSYDETLVDKAMDLAEKMFGQGPGFGSPPTFADAIEHLQRHGDARFVKGYTEANQMYLERVEQGLESVSERADALSHINFYNHGGSYEKH